MHHDNSCFTHGVYNSLVPIHDSIVVKELFGEHSF